MIYSKENVRLGEPSNDTKKIARGEEYHFIRDDTQTDSPVETKEKRRKKETVILIPA